MSKQWAVYDYAPEYVIVVPLDDTQEHDKFSKDCPCEPDVEVIGACLTITHNAFDWRHVAEWLNEGGES